MIRALLLFTLLVQSPRIEAGVVLGPWIPKFKGVDYSVSTNTPGAGAIASRRQVVHALRVDLHDPDVRLFSTPRHTNYIQNVREVGARTATEFLRTYELQAVINANFFSEGSYYLPAGYPMDLYGLAISEGIVVSPQNSSRSPAVMMFTSNNVPNVVFTNWPAQSTEGIYTAIAGDVPLVIAGVNVGRVRDTDPHTAFGVSQDRRYLYLAALDGRQPGYSEGSTDFETAAWMLQLGAYDAINVDGGGSTTLVLQNTTGAPIRMNKPSAVADSGRERTVGSHFGIYAKPVPGLINDVTVKVEDTKATVSFTTTVPASTQVAFGTNAPSERVAGLVPLAGTNHTVELLELTPDTGYYYQIIALAGEEQFTSPTYYFKTTNYVATNAVFDLTQHWRFQAGNAPAEWNHASFDDASWESGPGLLWADTRATPNPAVEPKATRMTGDASTSFPYITYYFRTPLPLETMRAGSALSFSGYIDDGAVFYLNGTEIYRLRMPEVFDSGTLADNYPCDGDATCPDEFTIPFSVLRGVVSSNNVLAVEVHNYNARSSDITFGLALSRIDPLVRSASQIAIRAAGNSITLSWEGSGTLQWSAVVDGPWYDVELGGSSPVTVTASEGRRFYRVRN